MKTEICPFSVNTQNQGQHTIHHPFLRTGTGVVAGTTQTGREIPPRLPSLHTLKVTPSSTEGSEGTQASLLVLDVVIHTGSFWPWTASLLQAEAAVTRHPQRLRARCPLHTRIAHHRGSLPPRQRPSLPRTPCARPGPVGRWQGGRETRSPPVFRPAWPMQASPLPFSQSPKPFALPS